MDMASLLWVLPILFIIAGILVTVKLTQNGGKGLLSGIVMLSVMIVLTATVLVPAIETTDEPHVKAPSWQYDDYYTIEGLDSASGSLEVVTLGSDEYLHVASIGEGTYTVGDNTYTVTTKKAQLDVFLIGGQSNAQYNINGTTELGDTDPVALPGTAYYYGLSSHPISMGNTTQAAAYDSSLYDIYMSVDSDGDNLLGNIEGPFSARYYSGTGHKVLTINTGVGGSSISAWVDGGTCYTYSKAAFADAMSKIDTDLFEVSVKSFFWIQGEADKYMAVNTYVSDFMDLYEDLTTNVFNSDYKLTYALISLTKDGKNAATAQYKLADKKGIYMASTAAESFSISDGTLRNDGLHYTQKGDNILARDFANLSINLWR